MVNLEATVGGLTFIGHEGAATYTIAEDGLKGWFVGGAAMRREYVDRPNHHGQFATPGYLSGRIVEISGKVLVNDDPEAFEDALDALDALLADGGSDTLTVTTPKGAKTAVVSRYGEPQLRIVVYGSVAEYQIQLWAPDPEKVVVP
jgi:hypothetical protein